MVVLVLTLAFSVQEARAQPASFEQDSTLNNLVHPEGYETAPLGTLGRVEKRGSGPQDLIVVSGDGFGIDAYEDFITDHRDAFTVYVVTLPGNEGTPAPPMPPEGTSYGEASWTRAAARGVADLIESRGLDAPIILGHFYPGGQIAVHLAAERPELLGGAVVVGAEATRLPRKENRPLSDEQRVKNVDQNLAPNYWKTVTRKQFKESSFPPELFTRNEAEAQRLARTAGDEPLPVQIQYLGEFFASDMRPLFPEVAVPLLVVRPGFSDDFLEGREWYKWGFWESWNGAEAANDLIEVETVEKARLFVWNDQPDAFDRLLSDFLDRVDG